MPQFQRLVRFLSNDGAIYYGDAILPTGVSDARQAKSARVISGDIFGVHKVEDKVVPIEKLLSPLAPETVSTARFLGLNYRKHAIETSMPIPKYPILFYKPSTSLAGPEDDIIVPRLAQVEDNRIDYECELVIVIGKQCRDVSEAEAHNYVLGYSLGNDVSQRTWQLQLGGSQWGVGKMFDTWAPFGPAIVSPQAVGATNQLEISTTLNGQVVQKESTGDMIFSVAQAVSFLSQGSTLQPGDVIFMGTPSGVGMGRSPQIWLKDGDVVEMSLSNVGTLRNVVRYQRESSKL